LLCRNRSLAGFERDDPLRGSYTKRWDGTWQHVRGVKRGCFALLLPRALGGPRLLRAPLMSAVGALGACAASSRQVMLRL
jgi:hypothetical protein